MRYSFFVFSLESLWWTRRWPLWVHSLSFFGLCQRCTIKLITLFRPYIRTSVYDALFSGTTCSSCLMFWMKSKIKVIKPNFRFILLGLEIWVKTQILCKVLSLIANDNVKWIKIGLHYVTFWVIETNLPYPTTCSLLYDINNIFWLHLV